MAKQAEDLLTGSLDQRVVYEACRRGILERQLPLLRRHYQQKRDVMVEALRRATFGDRLSWPAPRGGFFLWATLPPRDRRRSADPARRRSRRDLRGGRGVLRQRPAAARISCGCRSPRRRRNGFVKESAGSAQRSPKSWTRLPARRLGAAAPRAGNTVRAHAIGGTSDGVRSEIVHLFSSPPVIPTAASRPSGSVVKTGSATRDRRIRARCLRAGPAANTGSGVST